MSQQQSPDGASSNNAEAQIRDLPTTFSQLPRTESNSAQAGDGDQQESNECSSEHSSHSLELEAHEQGLDEQVRIEQETQEREAIWHRRLQSDSPDNPQASQAPSQTPPLVIGAPLGKNLTVVEAARRLVSQWEAIHQSTVSSNPEAAGPIWEELSQARAQLDALTAHQPHRDSHIPPLGEPNQDPATTPLNSLLAHKTEVVASRIEFLAASLADSTFPPERANITAAISLYRASRIPYSANWALLYAGHLVDFAPTYASFTADRAARLDRYSRLHGEGWLWIEPPLARDPAGPSPFFSARKGTFLPETDSAYDMGHYSVTMSFRRMKNLVYRGALVTNMSKKRKRDRDARSSDDEATVRNEKDWPARSAKDDAHEVYDDIDAFNSDSDVLLPPPRWPNRLRTPAPPPSSSSRAGIQPAQGLRRNRPSRHPLMARDPAAPTLHFRTLLDSGSTLPMLYNRDVRALGIHRASYAAVSRVSVQTASEAMATWLYEMEVAVVDTQTCEPLVSSSSPVWPAEEPTLGGVTLIMVRKSPRLDGAAPSFSSPCGGKNAVAKTTGDGETTFLENATSLIDIAEGRDYGRLSGLLPFKVCYLQSTPGLRTIWMGEDRRDVLGAHRMPGQMRWVPGTGRVCDPGHPRDVWKTVCKDDNGKPSLLRMGHEESICSDGEQRARLVDFEEKGWKGRSEVTVVDKKGIRVKHAIEPRTLDSQQRKQSKRLRYADELS
ncbi:hypothetical protein CORC01_13096 [Colletotrichum orchidophilum]|uniref:Uncharacterized protein n=1 Tax=Colletotrichum orchidophilum TaxID=1209926 RepID=A0A1G4AR36_9PEZI|nr:uncharacterized protein CORC01_13096 [Colletotrichum orchidophilum]OHE91619.1 hypothetical protein CORC01_13096 [Colletotrichum orchidophilum]